MERLYQQYKDKSEWYIVYIREAHSADGRQTRANESSRIEIKQPKTMEERLTVANTCVQELNLSIPAIIDGMDNKVGMDYDAFPSRYYVVDREGKIFYKSGKGPSSNPVEMEKALENLLGKSSQ